MRVILAEDSGVTRTLMQAVIAEAGHEVTAVPDGSEAWEAFSHESAPLVILDWVMPGLDGLEVCRRIRASERGNDAFVLLLTGRGTSEDLTAALVAGVDDFVAKPVPPEVLHARVIIAETRIRENAARRAAQEALARAQWLAGVGEATLAMQHEINNPLTALIAEAELLVGDVDAANPLRPALARILEQGQRIAQVVRQLAELDDPRSVEYLGGQRMLDITRPES